MNDSRLVKIESTLNEARSAAEDIAATLESLATLYADLAVLKKGVGGDEKRLAGTFSTIHARAEQLLEMIENCLT